MLKKIDKNVQISKSLAAKLRIAIVRTDYHTEINDSLEKHCTETLKQFGVTESNIKTFVAPGSWEIPLVVQTVAKSKRFDAVIAFGVIVRGDTYHFDMIANECARALMQLSLDYSIPIAIEILAVFNLEDAKKRAQDNDENKQSFSTNKGTEGAIAVLKTLSVLRQV